MTTYTDEQLRYISYSKKKHTLLIAGAGSGKTFTIIRRMSKLIEEKIYTSESILMISYSRFTRDDFLQKIKKYNATNIPITSVSTIDKFAKTIIDPNNTVDVSLLSYKMMKYLQDTPTSILKTHVILNKIKCVFVDESQDMNDTQYNICCVMSKKLGIIINLVGDKNQAIFQFRGCDNKFLREFETDFKPKTFVLTHNFRSHQSIVEFSKYLRPFNECDVVCTKGDNGCLPSLIFYHDEKILEEEIIGILTDAKNNWNIDLSDFAILAPVRGRMCGGGRSYGLCFISNILYKANIKFKQFYEESKDEISGEGIKYAPETGHVNILTYMGSKGLEWPYVIIIGADVCLINKNNFDEEKHKNDRYLLYVACSRAIHNTYIFSKCTHRGSTVHFNTNPWFDCVPKHLYHLDVNYKDDFCFPKLVYKTKNDRDVHISKIVDKLSCYDLDEISNLLDFQNRKVNHKKKIFKNDYSSIEKTSAIFLSRYIDLLFKAFYNIKMNRHHEQFQDIENILEGDNIVSGLSDEAAEWYSKNKKYMTWEKFDTMRTLDPLIKQAINNTFDRNNAFNSHVIALNGYYQTFILEQKKWIKNLYKKYLKCKNTVQIREILFHLLVIRHSIDTQHYFHIKSKGKKYEHILTVFKDMFDEIENYVDDMDYNFVKSNKIVDRWQMISKIDLIDDNDKLWYIKCSNEISLKHTIQSAVSYLMYNVHIIDDIFQIIDYIDGKTNDQPKHIDVIINYINFMKGEEISYIYTLKQETIRDIIMILQRNIEEKKKDEPKDISKNDDIKNTVVPMDTKI